MTFAELKQALADRGFDHLSETLRGQLINDARAYIDEMRNWPYREKSVTGTAPLTVTDLGTAEAVTNETLQYPLEFCDYQSLLGSVGDLSTTGVPLVFYIGNPSAVPVIATWPTNTDTIGVQYFRVTDELVDPTDVPEAPDRFHTVYVEQACVAAYRASDDFQSAQAQQAHVASQVEWMMTALMGGQQIVGPVSIRSAPEAHDA